MHVNQYSYLFILKWPLLLPTEMLLTHTYADLDISKSMFRNVLAGSFFFFAQLDSAVVSPPGTALIVNMI